MSGKWGITSRPWTVRVQQATARCDAEVMRHGARAQCFRTGLYGWGDNTYCCQHHPDWQVWFREQQSREKCAAAAEVLLRALKAARVPIADDARSFPTHRDTLSVIDAALKEAEGR